MLRKRLVPGMLALFLLASGGCGDATGPRLVTSFNWTEVEDPETIVEGISTSVAFGELFILGQIATPTRCYELDASFKRDRTKLNVRVTASSTQSPNCDVRAGGFRYTATMSNLDFQTYQLVVIHDVEDGTGGRYTQEVIIR